MSDEFKLKVNWGNELINLGLAPGTWKESLLNIEAKLSPNDWKKFSRLHKNFTGYRTEDTLSRFYNFVFGHQLQLEINRHRFHRLAEILEGVATILGPGQTILDLGAGSGLISKILWKNFALKEIAIFDPCLEIQKHLSSEGFSNLTQSDFEKTNSLETEKKTFNFILCADSLGEVNGDDDDLLAEASSLNDTDFAIALEERYGFVQKLAYWKPYLDPVGSLGLWEPFKHSRAWTALANNLVAADWKVEIKSNSQRIPFLVLRA